MQFYRATWLRTLVGALLLGAPGALAPPVSGETGNGFAEYEVKAAMMINFARFVEWPTSAFKDDRAPVIIGIFGSDPFGRSLDDALRDKAVDTRSIRVRRLKSITEAEGCHMLFVSRSEKAHVATLLSTIRSWPVLTISDTDAFAQMGGVIEFTVDSSRIRFEINQRSARTAGLTISSKLLKLASRVREGLN